MPVRSISAVAVALILGGSVHGAEAQAQPARPTITLTGGYAGFVDDSTIKHAVTGAGAEWLLTSRVALGPELLYLIGPGQDRDIFLLGVVRFGLAPFSRRIVPNVVVGGGVMSHSDRFNGVTFRAVEGALVAGGGVRVAVTPTIYLEPELTIGWEPHLRASINVGFRLGR